MNKRVRSVLVAGVSLVAVGAIGTVWATRSAAAAGRYVTAVAATGDVSQSFWATGTISRESLVDAAFSVTGTVKSLKAGVGDTVAAGDVLATLETAALKLTLLNAETDLASAKANLYAAEHPSSSSSGSRGSGSSASLPSGSGSSGSGDSSGGTSVPSGITAADAATLYEAIAAVNVATLAWSNPEQPTTCDLIHTALLNANQQATDPDDGSGEQTDPGTDTGSGDADDGTGDNGDSGAGSEDNGSSGDSESSGDSGDTGSSGDSEGSGDTGSGDESGDNGSEDTADPADDQSSGASAGTGSDTTDDSAEDTTQLALVTDDITLDDIKACGEARQELLLANAVLADYYQQLIPTGTINDGEDTPSTPSTPSTSTPSRSSGSSNASGSSSVTVSARAVASAEADVLRSQQAVDAAETALANAELVAPISGTVGAISLEKGASSAGGSITIVGEGTALVSIEVPLATRALVSQGMPATVTPAGSTQPLEGTVSNIAILETSGTAGDNPTYTTTIAVSDPGLALKSGAKACVEIVTATASDVVTVPGPAVTPTGSGTGTVQVVDSASSDTAQTVTVATGAVGAGRVEITDGLTTGQIVVLSDRTASIDSLTTSSTNSNRRVTGFAVPR